MKTAITVTLCFLSLVLLQASPGHAVDTNEDGNVDQWFEVADGRVERVSMDNNYDSRIDYNVEYDIRHRKTYEEMDFNHDGRMDDFYYFEEGKLVRQEIDSNFDGRIDIWVHLEGMYIRKYEMDSDFDGVVDVVKDYEQ